MRCHIMNQQTSVFKKYISDNKKNICFIIVILITLIRIILCNKILLRFRCIEVYDDQLLFGYAKSLLAGEWLGAYNNLTLVKGISYPVFIVLCNLLSIPYTAGLSLLNIGSALAFLKAVSPRLTCFYSKCIIYVLVIFAPTGFSAYITQRTYRMAIVPYVVLLVLSCMIGLYFRRTNPLRQWLPWSVGAGFSLSFFWYIREDSIWILPALFVIIVLTVIPLFKGRPALHTLMPRFALLLLPFLFLGLTTLFICSMNDKHYGIFATNDRTGSEFGTTMSYLYKIEDTEAPSEIWVSRKQLQKALDVSPTLSSAEKEIQASCDAWGNGGEIRGDLISWALRNGIQDAGYYRDASATEDFYKRVNAELDAAFQDGTLKEDDSIHFTSQSKGIDPGDIPSLFLKSMNVFYHIGNYELTGLKYEPYALGDLSDIRECEVLFGNLAYYYPAEETSDEIDTRLLKQEDPLKASGQTAIHIGNIITNVYKKLDLPVNILSAICYVVLCLSLILNFRKKRTDESIDLWLVITGFLLSALVLVSGVVFFSSWFPPEQLPFIYYYSAGAYPLIQLAKYLSIYCALKILFHKANTNAR